LPGGKQWDVRAPPCDTEKLSNLAWSLFGGIRGGWQRSQAICDYAHDRIEFGS
jgi:hypothetical protein